MNIKPLAALWLSVSLLAHAAEKSPQKIVEDWLAQKNAPPARMQLQPIADETVSATLPGQVCFAVLFAQFPVAVAPPEPLKSANLLVVTDGNVKAITDIAELEQFMKASLKPVTNGREAKAAVYTWLRLSQELHQDGFLKFSIPADQLSGDGTQASGKLVVEKKGGDQGDISVTLRFDGGKLTAVEEKVHILQGIRPKCQATKLTDPDPIVRQMAEQDILVMGKSCRKYLDEQRAKATPEVQQAIDRIWQQILDEGR